MKGFGWSKDCFRNRFPSDFEAIQLLKKALVKGDTFRCATKLFELQNPGD
jgi:hypothetical protein